MFFLFGLHASKYGDLTYVYAAIRRDELACVQNKGSAIVELNNTVICDGAEN